MKPPLHVVTNTDKPDTADALDIHTLNSRQNRLERIQRHQRAHYEWRDNRNLALTVALVAADIAYHLIAR